MADPEIAQKKPVILELDPGTYWYCTCGRSKNQPFCDGSHKRTEFTPLMFDIADKKKSAYCQCKRTKKDPFCDGTHKNL